MTKQIGGSRMMRTLIVGIVAAVTLTCLALVYAQRRRAAGTTRAGQSTASRAPRTITVKPKENLQAILDAARPGDEIVLQAGGVYRGAFTLRRKAGDEWITIRSSAIAQLPGEDVRISPAYSSLMPKLEALNGSSAIQTEAGAHHWRLIGLEVLPEPQGSTYSLISLGSDAQTRLEDIPHHIRIDRCYIHAHQNLPTRRGIALNSAETEIINSYISDIKEQGADNQAIMGWTGSGSYKIINNYLEAAGENILFGGGDPKIAGLVPSDIEIRRNHLFKQLAWKGAPWQVKNILELKNARRVVIDGNILENNWIAAQTGYAILFTVRNQDGSAPWSTVENVEFTNNLVRHTENGINILGRDNNAPSSQAKQIRIANNLFERPMAQIHKGTFLLIAEADAVEVSHNTVDAEFALSAYGKPSTNFRFTDNLFLTGFTNGDATGGGVPMLKAYFPAAQVRNNVLTRARERNNINDLPADNFYPASIAEVGLINAASDASPRPSSIYKLKPLSRYKAKAGGGKDPGCDFDKLESSLAGVADGTQG